jgi:hypothetical protein
MDATHWREHYCITDVVIGEFKPALRTRADGTVTCYKVLNENVNVDSSERSWMTHVVLESC